MVKTIEFLILRRDLGFSNEHAKNGITYATARSWGQLGVRIRRKSLAIDENYEKSINKTMKNDETLTQHKEKYQKTIENQ